ncbi:MAG: RNA-splicing factor [Lichina confinis]|nr:MAG: RNA-splicing factor [Lichina confinis]
MSSNVGLSTPRGSGTSGYVQRNLSYLKPRDNVAPYPSKDLDRFKQQHRQRQPDKDILEHERRRLVEVKVFELRDKLEDDEVDEEEIEKQTSELRKKLLAERAGNRDDNPNQRKHFKPHEVHEQARAKIEESEKLRKALGISETYEEGGHWRRQEERLRNSVRDQ